MKNKIKNMNKNVLSVVIGLCLLLGGLLLYVGYNEIKIMHTGNWIENNQDETGALYNHYERGKLTTTMQELSKTQYDFFTLLGGDEAQELEDSFDNMIDKFCTSTDLKIDSVKIITNDNVVVKQQECK